MLFQAICTVFKTTRRRKRNYPLYSLMMIDIRVCFTNFSRKATYVSFCISYVSRWFADLMPPFYPLCSSAVKLIDTFLNMIIDHNFIANVIIANVFIPSSLSFRHQYHSVININLSSLFRRIWGTKCPCWEVDVNRSTSQETRI